MVENSVVTSRRLASGYFSLGREEAAPVGFLNIAASPQFVAFAFHNKNTLFAMLLQNRLHRPCKRIDLVLCAART